MVCLRIAARSTNNSPDSLWSLDSAFGTRIFEGVPHGWYFEQKYRFLANEGGGGDVVQQSSTPLQRAHAPPLPPRDICNRRALGFNRSCCDGGYGVARARRRRAKQGVALCTGGAAARWYVVIVGCVPAPRRAMLRQGLRGCAHRFGLRHPWHVCKWYARPHRVEPGCDKGLRGCAHRSRLRHR